MSFLSHYFRIRMPAADRATHFRFMVRRLEAVLDRASIFDAAPETR